VFDLSTAAAQKSWRVTPDGVAFLRRVARGAPLQAHSINHLRH